MTSPSLPRRLLATAGLAGVLVAGGTAITTGTASAATTSTTAAASSAPVAAVMALAESPRGCSSKVPTLCVGQGSAWGSSRSAMATGSSQWGQGPPRPMRVQGWLQSGHHCWAW